MKDDTSPDWENAALLTIDIQKSFALPGACAEILGTWEVIPKIQQLLQAFRQSGKPIIHVIRIYLPDGSNVDLCRRQDIKNGKQVAVHGTDGVELVNELKPSFQIMLDIDKLISGAFQWVSHHEWIMYKPRWGAFFQTSLEKHLREYSINTLVICGCNFPNCPRTTIYEASERDFRVVFIPNATSQVYERGLQELRNIGVILMSTEECIALATQTVKTSGKSFY
ncbi:cysteine hydrolase [Brasilonema octagenarum UFV-E1]|uniref:Cysteine hydrolase n=2 Tax=Brasilonema TaxID=383614 RepID=A0A856MDT4_9CYAN|nr:MULTISPECIES: isochorismatase family cysteine hydrolase [Brasilonema]NMF65660.1 cysteine hydrolase [Brasilonema octagenarum UFV-OR1]QDL08832.1 cysteine hydrolase [Brasilonema sennae CENA114]QDL15189.1 cysteine hydrolase [Brasilonema octagenarum UFV-E1]